MGIMIIPFVSSLSDDVINAVPQSLRDGSYALGATQSETIRQVVLPAALPGIVGGVLLAVSRAIGETMIVVMAAGLAANLTANPLEAVTTVTVQIVTLLVGDQEFDSPKTLAAFALGPGAVLRHAGAQRRRAAHRHASIGSSMSDIASGAAAASPPVPPAPRDRVAASLKTPLCRRATVPAYGLARDRASPVVCLGVLLFTHRPHGLPAFTQTDDPARRAALSAGHRSRPARAIRATSRPPTIRR